MYSETISQQNDVSETILEPDLSSNNSNDSFFLDISKLKRKLILNYVYFNFVNMIYIYYRW